jgi:hypothetical protein
MDCNTPIALSAINSPLLQRCGLTPIAVDDSRWRRLVVRSLNLSKNSALPVASSDVCRLIIAGGRTAYEALHDDVKIGAVRREMSRVRDQLEAGAVGREENDS